MYSDAVLRLNVPSMARICAVGAEAFAVVSWRRRNNSDEGRKQASESVLVHRQARDALDHDPASPTAPAAIFPLPRILRCLCID